MRITLTTQLEEVENKEKELEKALRLKTEILEKISGMTQEEAKIQLIETIKEEANNEAMAFVRDIMDEAKITAQNEARKIR